MEAKPRRAATGLSRLVLLIIDTPRDGCRGGFKGYRLCRRPQSSKYLISQSLLGVAWKQESHAAWPCISWWARPLFLYRQVVWPSCFIFLFVATRRCSGLVCTSAREFGWQGVTVWDGVMDKGCSNTLKGTRVRREHQTWLSAQSSSSQWFSMYLQIQ